MPRQADPHAKPRDGWSKHYTRDVADYTARTHGVLAAFVLSRHLCELGTRTHSESLRSLAAATGISRNAMRAATDALCADGLLSRDPETPRGRTLCTYAAGERLLAMVNGETMAHPASHSPDTMAHPASHSPQTMAHPVSHSPQTMALPVSHRGAPGEPFSTPMALPVSQNGAPGEPPSRRDSAALTGSSRVSDHGDGPSRQAEPPPCGDWGAHRAGMCECARAGL